jgi:maltooligosyltrehalose trehalohydrolase
MRTFRVWAPRAGTVELVVDGRRVAMNLGDGGWWWCEVDAGPGADYTFSLDGGPAIPDPRSPWQPNGVDGPSRVVDHRAFPWTDAGWTGIDLRRAVIYELHVGTFSPAGTFDGVVERLDHLIDLGVDVIELMPVAQFSGERNWGYDGVDLYAPHESYGGPDGLFRLVDACHQLGLGVILDVVYNHVGPEGNHLARFGPYFTEFYRTAWGEAVNFDQAGSDGVRRFVVDNALMWLRDYHIDGLRIDAVHAIVDTSAIHILEELATEVDRLGHDLDRRCWLIAESDLNDPRVIAPRESGGFGIDAQWSDDFHHALHVVLTGERSGYYVDFVSMADMATACERAWVYETRYSQFRERTHGREHGGLPGWRFLAYLQNHDQVGNRATGDRLSASLSIERLRVAAALYLLSPFTPLIFQGEEWGATTPFQYFTSHVDHELGRAVAAGRRSEFAAFGWDPATVPDPQDPATYERSRLDWTEPPVEPHASLLAWYRACIALRRATPVLRDGRLDLVRAFADDHACTLVVLRGDVTIALNLGEAAATIELADRAGRVMLASPPDLAPVGSSLRLTPDSVVVLGA